MSEIGIKIALISLIIWFGRIMITVSIVNNMVRRTFCSSSYQMTDEYIWKGKRKEKLYLLYLCLMGKSKDFLKVFVHSFKLVRYMSFKLLSYLNIYFYFYIEKLPRS